jgi:hypothetical protein
VDLELVRNGSNIDAHVSNFSSDYAGYDYTFELRAYNDSALTSQNENKSFNTASGFSVPQSFTGLSDITTNAYYFELNEFYNDTAGVNVYANVDAKPDRLTQRVYDVRGLAYFRDSWTDYQLNDLNLNDVIDLEPNSWNTDILSDGAATTTVRNSENALSADGTVLCSTYVFNNHKIYCALYKYYHNKWVLKSKITSINTTIVGSNPYRYPFDVYEFHQNKNYSCMALSGDASRLVVIGGTNTAVYDISPDLKSMLGGTALPLPQPNPYTQIHDVSISMDGNTILISGCQPDFTTGYAHVFYRDTGAVFDLSSSQVPGYVSSFSYGTDCTLSGDGRTAAIFGSHVDNTTAGAGYIWKINEFSNDWEFVYKVDFAYTHRKVSCKLSHSGDTLFVCAPRTTGGDVRGAIFERDDTTPPTWVNVQNITETEMDSGSMAGDGKTIAYVSTTNGNSAGNVVFNLWKRSPGNWTKHINSDTSHAKPQGYYVLSDSELSFDGSRFFAWRNWYDVDILIFPFLDIISDKTQPVSNVLDYMNVKSNYFYFNYSFDYTTITPVTWNVSEPLQIEIHDIQGSGGTNGYGHWDNTSISADGRFVLVGAPAENKVYMYDTHLNRVDYTFTESATYFGLRCAMDDEAKKFVVVAHNNIYFYERRSYSEEWSRGNVAHGYGSSLFQLKMSKDGSTVLLTEAVGSKKITKWDLGTDWTWDVSELSTNAIQSNITGQFGTERLSAIDLSYNGDYIVAGQHITGQQGDLTVFYPGGGKKSVVVHMNTSIEVPNRYMHSVAISSEPNANGEYTIITGEAIQQDKVQTTTTFHIIRFDEHGSFVDPAEYTASNSYSLSGLPEARYGRTAAMSHDGSLAVLSGTREYKPDVTEYNIGGAVIIDTIQKTKLQTVDFEGTLRSAGIVENRYNGYGSSCRISSDNQHVLVGGGGYAFKYTAINVKSLYFPFTTGDGVSSDRLFTFSGSGASYDSTNGLTLDADESVSISLNDTFKFSNTAGFMFTFEAKTSGSASGHGVAIDIRVDNSINVGVGQSSRQTHQVFANIKKSDETVYIDRSTGDGNSIYNQYTSFNIRFDYDDKLRLSSYNVRNVPSLLGSTGFKPFDNPQVLTIYSQTGASIKNLRMYAFE